jgi:superfamily II DNA or RNA helicase
MYGLQKFGKPGKMLKNYVGEKMINDSTFKGELYENQKFAANILLDELLNKSSGGILSLMTGEGKTITSLYVLSQLKAKTIVVVNKIPLMKQWESEIKQFLPNLKVGCIQGQKNVNTEDCDIVIAMLQSLAKIDYPDSLFEDFGTVVIDEIHNTSSKVFSKVLSKLCCKYTIGLSATPQRSDGCEHVFKYHIGNIVYQSQNKKRKGKDPVLQMIKIDSKEYKEITTINKFTGQTQIQFTSMLNDLISMPKRNKLIIELVKEYVNENRKILVLSDRRNHLINLKKQLDEDLNIVFSYGLFLGSMKISELNKSKASQVILATYSAFGEGVSEKDLDTLILTTPKKFIGHLKNTSKNDSGKLEQIIGRIFRKEHIEKNPLIVDLNDNFSVYKNQSNQRKAFYKQHFKNSIVKYQNINLDDYILEEINTGCISKFKNKQIIDESKNDNDYNNNNNNNNLENLFKNCIIDE